jgi:hypothetical protein
MKREHVFSPCRRYRYTLWREWAWQFLPGVTDDPGLSSIGRQDQFVQFVGLNPSTADEVQDDPTVRRCVGYAKRWGFGAMCMTNVFAWRDTDPEAMKRVPSPVSHGSEWVTAGLDEGHMPIDANDYWLQTVAASASLVVAAWGTHGDHRNRAYWARALLAGPKLHSIGVKLNEDGSPRHPLYLAGDLLPVPYPP